MLSCTVENQPEPLDTLRITPQQWRQMLAELEQRPEPKGKANRRRHERRPFMRSPQVRLKVTHPGGFVSDYLAWSRDISPSGIGLLHGTYLYEGSPVVVTLIAGESSTVPIQGVVTNCSLLSGRTHMVGIRFHEEIEVEPFLFNDKSGILKQILSETEEAA